MAHALAASLLRLDERIEREVLRLRVRYQLSVDEFRGLYVSDQQVDRLIAASREPDGAAPPVASRPAAGAAAAFPRWRQVAETFALSPLEEDLLLVATAPELDLKYETLYAYLNDDVTRKWPTADLAQRLLADVDDAGDVLGALAPGATLMARQILRRVAAPAARPAVRNVGFALDPALAHWLHGQDPGRAAGAGAVEWHPAGALPPAPEEARARAAAIARLFEPAGGRRDAPPVIALVGAAGSGRAAIAAALAAGTGRALVRLRVDVLPRGEEEIRETLGRLGLALALQPAVVLVEGFEPLRDEDAQPAHELRLARAMAGWPDGVPVLLRTADEQRWGPCASGRRSIEVRCGGGGFEERVALWSDAARAEAVPLPGDELRDIAGRFALTAGQVQAALATARDLAVLEGAPAAAAAHVAAAARAASDQALRRLGTKVEAGHGWTDLVLPPATLRRLRELAAAIRHRHFVYGAWGFGERITSGAGVKALFAGASGTGKTMAAGVIARELGLDLYKVDLSALISKYIGETEKNLARVFRAARASNAVLFLDEAEAITGKRSEVKDAHDRYANVEVAYLLQSLEDHDGVAILATNLKGNIDEAFHRRLHYVIDFPRPGQAERESIWRGMFPAACPLDPALDFGFLARQFDLAGGDIRNVALEAAFLAAQHGGPVGMGVLVEALARQLAKQGKAPTAVEFRPYQALLPGPDGRRPAGPS